MDSHFWDIIRDIRSLIQKPDDALFIVHPPIEAIAIDRFVYRAEAGFVFFQENDENGRELTAGFSEPRLKTPPFEVGQDPTVRTGRSNSIPT
jgi:hypothetical protein